MNADTSGLTVAGHIGTWHTIDQHEVGGHSFYLMEHGRSRRLHYCGMGWQTQWDGKDRDLCAWQKREVYHCD